MKRRTHRLCPATLAAALASSLSILPIAQAASLQWDATPATTGIQDGAGNWSNLGSLTNWWDGTQNVAWVPGATAVIGYNLTNAATVTITNPIVAGGLSFSNNPPTAITPVAYTVAAASGGNLTLIGSPATVLSAVNYPSASAGATANETVSASLIATGGLQVLSASTPPWVAQISFNSATNYFGGTLEIGTPGNASYTTPTALQAQFNSSGIGAGSLSGCNTLIVHSNASVLIRGGSGAFTLGWPKKFILSGDGIPNSSFSFAAVSFAGNNGTLFPADIQLAGDTSVSAAWGVANVILTNSGSISGTGRLRLCASPNRPTSGTVILKGKHTYVGDTIIDGTLTVQLASSQDDRLPTGTSLKLGTTGLFYGSTATGVPQSGYNGYGRLVLGDAFGAVNQTLAGLTNDFTLTSGSAACWVAGGNSTNISTLTLNSAADWTYNARLGGSATPDKMLGLVKAGAGTLYLQGTNLCAGGYTVNSGALVIGDGSTDNPLSGPIINNAAVTINAGSSLTYTDAITGNGLFTKGSYGTLALTGTNTSTGGLVVQSGTLILNPTLAGSESLLLASTASLQLNRATGTDTIPAASASFDTATLNLDMGFNLTGPTATALLTVSGALTNNGYTTVNITRSGALTVGSFPLIKYGTYRSNDYSALALSAFAPGITADIRNNPANHTIDLVILQIAGNSVKWTGAADNNWDATTVNWLNRSSLLPTAYAIGDFALFDDTATGPSAILLNSDPQPNSLTVSNVTKPYSFSGFAGIGGPATLVKQGAGTLTVAVNNNNVGGTQVQGGTLQVGDGSVDGTITAPILDNAALVFNVALTSTAGDITGTGSLAKTGPGQLNLGGNSAYQGATTVQQGTLYVQSSAALGASTNGTTVQAGGELWVDAGGLTIPEPLTLSGAGISGVGGALNASANAVATTWSGSITANTNAAILALSGSTLTLAGSVNAGTNSLVFQPNGSAIVTVSSNLTAGALKLNDSGAVRLAAPNNLTNLAVLLPGAGLWAYDSAAFGTNSTVLVTNGTTPGSYARVGVANNVTMPATVSLIAQVPGGGVGSPASYRITLDVGAAGDTNNTWNGPISLYGQDPAATGVPGYFILASDNGQAVINGSITEPPGQTVNLQLRGTGPAGVLNGKINLNTNSFTRTDTALWTVASTGNVWDQTIIFNGRLLLGINEALPSNAPLRMDNTACILDLNGFSQHVPALTNSGNTVWGIIANSSSNAPSTFIYQGGASSFGGSFNATAGAQPLHLDVASGILSLTATNNYSGNTTIRNGATLALTGGGTVSGTALLDLQAGGTLDLSALTTGTWTSDTATTLAGNGTVLGNLTVGGGLAPGESIGRLSVTGDLALAGPATTTMEVNRAANTNDVLSVGGTLTYGGTLVINKLGSTPYAPNDVFKLFSATAYSGAFANIIFPGVTTWDASRLPVDGTIEVLSVLPTTPTNLSFTVVGGNSLQLSWPATYVGWYLQMQTNAPGVGLTTNWFIVPNSLATNQVTLPIVPASGSTFFRLLHP